MNLRSRLRAFSLVELLVVIVVIGIIASFAVPAMQGMLRGSALSQASSTLTDQMSFARQYALSHNRIVEVRFYRFADPEMPGEDIKDPNTWVFRAFQLFEVGSSSVPIPIGTGVQLLPNTVMMNPGEDLSSLLGENMEQRLVKRDQMDQSTAPELPRGIKHAYDYMPFRFLPDGTTSLPPTGTRSKPSAGGRWYITIHATSDLPKTQSNTKAPPNFFTWMIDPVSGTSKTFRPSVR